MYTVLSNEWETIVTVILPWWKEIEFPKWVDANWKLRADVLEMFKNNFWEEN